jgi:hypothetical protein
VRRAGVRREWKEKKGGALRRGAPLKAARGGGRVRRKRWAGTAVETAGEAMGIDKAVAAAVQTRSARPGRLYSDHGTDRWAPHSFDFFSNLSKTGSTLKI